VLISGPEVLESTRNVDTIVLDKTGTVTTGKMVLVDVIAGAGTDGGTLLRYAGALEDASEHPVARAIARGARAQLGALPAAADFTGVNGRGVRGTVDGRAVVVGRESLLTECGIRLDATLSAAKARAESEGKTAVAVGWDGLARGVLVVADTVKPSSAEAVRQFTGLGLTPVLLTGDNATVAARIADELGIARVIADAMPADKVAAVKRLQAEGKVVAMVGDGVNDAAALAAAELGLAMGTGTDIAIQAADLIVIRGDLRAAVDAIRLSRRTLATIKTNLLWAFGYNLAAIPLAALGMLNPMFAGAAMAASSLLVVGNSLRLRSFTSVINDA
jgi:P-type Cu+ transporter